jgi:transcriptional regulator with XRE-family HTH domain
MDTLPITESMRQLVLQAIRSKRISQAELGKRTGLSKTWVSNFLGGRTKTVKVTELHKLEDELEISFFKVERNHGPRSPLADRIASLVDHDPKFAQLAVALEDALTEARGAFTPRFIPTQEMAKTGKAIIKIVDADRAKPGKVAREVLSLLS